MAIVTYSEQPNLHAARQPEPLAPPAHLSIRLGEYAADDLATNNGLAARCRWLAALASACRKSHGLDSDNPAHPRVSTCLIVDDSHAALPPRKAFDALTTAAQDTELSIDYVGRRSALLAHTNAAGDRISPAEIALASITPPPLPGDNGRAAGVHASFMAPRWLANGRMPSDAPSAETPHSPWQPGEEITPYKHSVLRAIELYRDTPDSGGLPGRDYADALLDATWTLLQLGRLYDDGIPAIVPQLAANGFSPDFPAETWDDLPAVLQLNTAAAPFYACRASILYAPSQRNYDIAAAARTILMCSVMEDANPSLYGQTEDSASMLALDNRVSYVFM